MQQIWWYSHDLAAHPLQIAHTAAKGTILAIKGIAEPFHNSLLFTHAHLKARGTHVVTTASATLLPVAVRGGGGGGNNEGWETATAFALLSQKTLTCHLLLLNTYYQGLALEAFLRHLKICTAFFALSKAVPCNTDTATMHVLGLTAT